MPIASVLKQPATAVAAIAAAVAVAAAAFMVFFTGRTAPEPMLVAPPDPGAAMATHAADPRFVGSWRKATRDACAARYPATWRLDANGLYTGQAEQPGEFTWWDSGTWRQPRAGELALSVANDAVERYTVVLEGRVLAITDPQGCVVRYERES